MDNLLADLLQDFQHLRKFNYQEILRVLRDEHTLFGHTLQSGKKILEGMMEKQLAEGKKQIEGSQLFLLYDSFGFPIELTKEITQEKGLQIDEEGFQSALAAAKEKSRQATKEMFKKGTDWSKYLEGIPQTEFIGYSAFSSDHSTLLKTINLPDGQQALIFDKTPFYPEMGGQMGDVGEVTLEDGEVKKVNNVQKFAGVILHFI
jgi:alanyl-tRNA synthetase